MNEFNIQSLHGQYFTAEICFTDVVGRISVNENGDLYLCQNAVAGGGVHCSEFFGYRHVVYVDDIKRIPSEIQNLKILPNPIEYHKLLTETMADWEKTFDSNDFVSKIASFLGEIKVFDPKNLGNNQEQL